MSISPRDLGDQWQGLEPEQPPSSRAAFWVALLAGLLLLGGALSLAAFLLAQGDPAAEVVSGGPDTGQPVVIEGAQATATGEPAPAAATDEAAVGATTDATSSIAPTVTLPGQPGINSRAVAVRLAAPPTIDASLTEWDGVPASRSDTIVFADAGWDGSDDLDASWQLAWDEGYLYLAVTVVDDTHAQNQIGNTVYQGDSVELQIDTDRQGDFGPALSPDDFQISLSPGDFVGVPPWAFRFQGTADGEMRDAPGEHGMSIAARPQPDGYTLETAIPWRDLNLVPSAGLELGLALNANDNDRPGEALQEVMKSNAPSRTFRDPTTWGVLMLQ